MAYGKNILDSEGYRPTSPDSPLTKEDEQNILYALKVGIFVLAAAITMFWCISIFDVMWSGNFIDLLFNLILLLILAVAGGFGGLILTMMLFNPIFFFENTKSRKRTINITAGVVIVLAGILFIFVNK